MSSGPMWSNNSLLRALQMTAIPGSFGKTGEFGLTSMPVQQVQHVHATDSCLDLTPTRLGLWLSMCCHLGTDDFMRMMTWQYVGIIPAQFAIFLSGLNPRSTMRYYGVLLPMVETYPLLKVYDG